MNPNILTLAKKFISVPSVAGNTQALDEVFEIAKGELAGFQIKEFRSNDIPSFLATYKKSQNDHFKIILNAHLDVVDGKKEQYLPEERGGKLFGRGAYDMKATAAVMILLFKEISGKVDFPLGLQITTDEEVGGIDGTGYQLKKGVRGDFAITGEGTNFRIVNEAKTRMILKLHAKGKNSHSAYPWLGENAILKMQKAVARIYAVYPDTTSEWSGTTLAITSIGSNNQIHNRTPDHCEAILDARVIADEKKTIIKRLKEIVSSDVDIEIIQDSFPHQTSSENEFIKKLQGSIKHILGNESILFRAHGESDARYFTASGCEGIEFGPTGGGHHGDEEWVDIKSLEDYYKILERFILNC